MGDVVYGNFSKAREQNVSMDYLEKDFRQNLERVNPALASLAASIVGKLEMDLKEFDAGIGYKIKVPRPVNDDGTFSEDAYQAIAAQVNSEVAIAFEKLRRLAHLRIIDAAYFSMMIVGTARTE